MNLGNGGLGHRNQALGHTRFLNGPLRELHRRLIKRIVERKQQRYTSREQTVLGIDGGRAAREGEPGPTRCSRMRPRC